MGVPSGECAETVARHRCTGLSGAKGWRGSREDGGGERVAPWWLAGSVLQTYATKDVCGGCKGASNTTGRGRAARGAGDGEC
jgi:hypothetical protein